MKHIICLMFLLLVWRAAAQNKKKQQSCPSPCDPGWTLWRNSCYRFYNTPRLNFEEAEAYCNQFDNGGNECRRGHLVAIDSTDENEFIFNWWKTIRGTNGHEVRIGFTDTYSEGTWNWSDGTSGTYTNWDSGQPDNYGSNQDCAVMWKRGQDVGAWDDEGCTLERSFICEIRYN